MNNFESAYPRYKKIMLWVGAMLGSLVLLLILLSLSLWWWASQPVVIPHREVQVKSGDSAEKVAIRMVNQGVDFDLTLFRGLAALTRKNTTVKPGYYALPARLSPMEFLNLINSSERIKVRVSIPEGWRFQQMRDQIDAQAGLTHDTAGWSDLQLMSKINPQEKYAEGQFFPSTYSAEKGSSDLALYKMAYHTMQKKLEMTWQKRCSNTPLENMKQLLILSSIVEKETGAPDDRDKVAAVFTNRLRVGMRLQTDPTVIYGMGRAFDGNLRKVDLLRDTPYNSYTRAGLPPTPIALPGEAALAATSCPAKINALYFVAEGNGRSFFSDKLETHNQAVKKFQLKR